MLYSPFVLCLLLYSSQSVFCYIAMMIPRATPSPPNRKLSIRDGGLNPFDILPVPDAFSSPDTSPSSSVFYINYNSKMRHSSSNFNGTSTLSAVTATATASASGAVTVFTNSPGMSSSSSSSSAPAPAPATSSAASQSSSSSSDASSDNDHWKTIGVAVIVVALVAVIILGTLFFDQWWTQFLRPFVLQCSSSSSYMRRNGSSIEELLPDWSTRTWRYDINDRVEKCASGGDYNNDSKHVRHPSMASFSSLLLAKPPKSYYHDAAATTTGAVAGNVNANTSANAGFLPVSPFFSRSHTITSATAAGGAGSRWSYNSAPSAPPTSLSTQNLPEPPNPNPNPTLQRSHSYLTPHPYHYTPRTGREQSQSPTIARCNNTVDNTRESLIRTPDPQKQQQQEQRVEQLAYLNPSPNLNLYDDAYGGVL